MKEKLLKNWGLKLMAVLIAFLVWFLVANIEDYTVTKTITGIPVEIMNEDAITGQDMVYDIIQGKTVDIKVEGRRSIVEQLTQEDFTATADLSELSITNSVQITVEAASSVVRREVVISIVDSMMKVAIEERGEQKLPISVITSGQTQEGYAVVSAAATPNMVTISGAASLVKDVKTVQVIIDVEGLNTGITTRGDLILLDADGDTIDAEKLTLNLTSVAVNVSIQKTKEVPITVTPTGEVAEGYSIAGEIEYQPTTVLIAGDAEELRNVREINIGDIDVTGKTADYEVTVDIDNYLPAGIVVADQTQNIAIKINIEKLVEKKLTLKLSDIRLEGKADGFDYQLAEDGEALEITVVGLKRDLDELTIGRMLPTIDVSEMLQEGTYAGSVTLQEVTGVQYQNTITVTVEVQKKKATETEEETTASSTEHSTEKPEVE